MAEAEQVHTPVAAWMPADWVDIHRADHMLEAAVAPPVAGMLAGVRTAAEQDTATDQVLEAEQDTAADLAPEAEAHKFEVVH